MSSLLSEGSRNDEIQYIREDVSTRLGSLKQRLKRWWSAFIGLGAGSLTLIIGGASMLALGQMPDSIVLVSPAVETVSGGGSASSGNVDPEMAKLVQTMTDFVGGTLGKIIALMMVIIGIVQGIARQSIVGFVMGVAPAIAISQMPAVIEGIIGAELGERSLSPFAAIHSEFEVAVEAENWPEAWQLLESVPASNPDLTMLKAQVAFQVGREDQSLQLVEAGDLGSIYPARTWKLESLYAQQPEVSEYQLTDASMAYAEDQASRRSLGSAMLRNSVPFGVLALMAGAVAIVLRRNVSTIEAWVTPTEKPSAPALPTEASQAFQEEYREWQKSQMATASAAHRQAADGVSRRDSSGNLMLGTMVAATLLSESDSDAECGGSEDCSADDSGGDDCGSDDGGDDCGGDD